MCLFYRFKIKIVKFLANVTVFFYNQNGECEQYEAQRSRAGQLKYRVVKSSQVFMQIMLTEIDCVYIGQPKIQSGYSESLSVARWPHSTAWQAISAR